jgi:hypothetical protein
MKLFIVFSLLILNIASSMAQQNPLSKYQWKNRILVIYASDTNDAKNQEQQNKYNLSKAEYYERDLLVFRLSDNNLRNLTNSIYMGTNISALKEFLSIENNDNFKVFLIGKDGSIKLQSEQVLSNQKLFTTIDGMPMRRNEMRGN